jgi:membrane protein required for beta-lactamase induction
MTYDKKGVAFIVITLLFLLTLTLPKVNYGVLIPMYIVFVLIGLYELGKDKVDEEESESQSK